MPPPALRDTSFTPSILRISSMTPMAAASRASCVSSSPSKLSEALICVEFTLGMKEMGMSRNCSAENASSATESSMTSGFARSAPRSSHV